jgi:perosamine synthetase
MIPISKPIFDKEEINEVKKVIESGFVAQGKKVEEFEKKFSNYINTNHAIAVTNGTVALDIALKAAGIKQGDCVITPSFTFIATANSILFQGAKPIFADVDEKSFNINPNDVLEKITNKTKAIIGVHLFGHPFNIKAIQDICEDHNLILIEDCAQAHGAEYDGKRVGNFGLSGCFSFYATKNMATGEGGMITTNNDEISNMCRMLINHGESQKYHHTILGYNYRMMNLQAALGLVQLNKLDKFSEKRINNAEYLNQHLKIQGLNTPSKENNVKHVYHQYAITIEDGFPLSRDEFMQYLQKKGIGCAVHYPLPIHKQPLYEKLGYIDETVQCPISIELSKNILSLPIHPLLTEKDLKYIVEIINNITKI